MASPATPGLLFCTAACILLIFVSISSPTWNKITFLSVNNGGKMIHFGCFGYTGSSTHIGYTFNSAVLGFDTTNINTDTLHNLTRTLILHPIAAGLSGLAVIFGLCGAAYHRAGTILMALCAGLAFLITLLAWVIDMSLWGIVRNRIRNTLGTHAAAQYGNANWITLGALIALALSFCLGACGSLGRYRSRRDYRV